MFSSYFSKVTVKEAAVLVFDLGSVDLRAKVIHFQILEMSTYFCRSRMFLWSSLILGTPTICKAPFVIVHHPMDFLARAITPQFVCVMEDWFS